MYVVSGSFGIWPTSALIARSTTHAPWCQRPVPIAAPVFHAGAIAHLKARQEDHAAAWRAWFAGRGIEPLEIVYEEFAQQPQPVVRRVLDHIGVPSEGVHVPEPPMRRQSDARSQEWVDRFRDEVPA